MTTRTRAVRASNVAMYGRMAYWSSPSLTRIKYGRTRIRVQCTPLEKTSVISTLNSLSINNHLDPSKNLTNHGTSPNAKRPDDQRSAPTPSSPLSEAADVPLGEGAVDISDAQLDVCSRASRGFDPEREAPRRGAPSAGRPASAGSGSETTSEGIDPSNVVTCPNEFEYPGGDSGTVVLCTTFLNRIPNAEQSPSESESVRIKQEEVSYDWAGSQDDDPLPDISELSNRFGGVATGLRSARAENNMLKECMAKITKLHSESSESSASTRSNHSSSGKYKRPAWPKIGIFGMRSGEAEGSDSGRIPFHDKGKWPLGSQKNLRRATKPEKPSCELTAQNDREYDAESQHLDNLMAIGQARDALYIKCGKDLVTLIMIALNASQTARGKLAETGLGTGVSVSRSAIDKRLNTLTSGRQEKLSTGYQLPPVFTLPQGGNPSQSDPQYMSVCQLEAPYTELFMAEKVGAAVTGDAHL
ncbi:hypothetical protein FIBSPDRAFT_903794 [Athelia psychrophila]|uniref:Uncharacterized protein n=1 Tax=Athelia psychrophila TaxID=1759441 RepID=A0A167VJ37_9AGAM|nr:hypothetical protein FIBSPDRAFT_903794 [Fibularhizoctonia sp. CBS 109695]